MIKVSNNIGDVQRRLQKVHKKTIFAESEALNQTAKVVAKAQRDSAVRSFDRPTPYLLNGIYNPKSKLGFVGVFSRYNTLRAELIPGAPRGRFTDGGKRVNRTLGYQVDGGIRTPDKRALIVPTLKARKNKFGNLSRRYVQNLLAKPNHVQLGRRDGVEPGIYRRTSRGKLTMLVAYEPQARYSPRFPYYRVASSVFAKQFDSQFAKAFEEEMKGLK